MNNKRKLRKQVYYILGAVFIVVFAVIIYFTCYFNIKFIDCKSVHEDALKYQTKNSLVFYPDSNVGRKYAKKIADNALKDEIIDYALVPYGDFYMVCYKNEISYYIDKNKREMKINKISKDALPIISDYLRYNMKKDEIDEAYTYDYLLDTYYKNIKTNDFTCVVNGINLDVHSKKYDYDFKVPIKYLQNAYQMNLGYEDDLYIKPRYVSKKRKAICFTFDDGPDMNLETSGQIVEDLYKLDSSASFFVIGYRLGEKQIEFCKQSINKGMEYGSHSQNHLKLTKLKEEEIYEEIMEPYHDLYDGDYGFGYKMKIFRPPYGNVNKDIIEKLGLTSILWNVDSLDWLYRTKMKDDECIKTVYEKVLEEADENDVVLFHDIYKTSVDAASLLLQYYINEGYQVVNVSELMSLVDKTDVLSFSGQ